MIKDSEEQDQKAYMKWLALAHPNLYKYTHHSPNGGARNAATGAKLKAMGTKPGFPDIFCYVPMGGYQGMVIEMKKPVKKGERKGVVSTAQHGWLDHFKSVGYMVFVCNGFEEARESTDFYAGLSTPDPS